MPTEIKPVDPFHSCWDYAIPCSLCTETYGVAYLKPNGRYYGPCCERKVSGKILLEQKRNIKEPIILDKHYKYIIMFNKIKSWWIRCVTPSE